MQKTELLQHTTDGKMYSHGLMPTITFQSTFWSSLILLFTKYFWIYFWNYIRQWVHILSIFDITYFFIFAWQFIRLFWRQNHCVCSRAV